jgi:hypothetical protein
MKIKIWRDPIFYLTLCLLALAAAFHYLDLRGAASLLVDFAKIQFSLGFFKAVTEPLATRRFQHLIFEVGVIGVRYIDEQFPHLIADCDSEEDVRNLVASYLRKRTDVAWDRFMVDKEEAVQMGVNKCMEMWRIDKFIQGVKNLDCEQESLLDQKEVE